MRTHGKPVRIPVHRVPSDSELRRDRILAVVVIVGVLLALAAALVLSGIGVLPDPGIGPDIPLMP